MTVENVYSSPGDESGAVVIGYLHDNGTTAVLLSPCSTATGITLNIHWTVEEARRVATMLVAAADASEARAAVAGGCAVIPVETGQRRIDREAPDDPDYGERRYFIGERSSTRLGEEQWWHITYADGDRSQAPESSILRDPIDSEPMTSCSYSGCQNPPAGAGAFCGEHQGESGIPLVPSPVCRRCSECIGAEHHWIDNLDGDLDGDATYACKHCDDLGDECETCDGEGGKTSEDGVSLGLCPDCKGYGVVRRIVTAGAVPTMPAKFSPLHARLFTAPELAEYLSEALGELQYNADAGCSNRVPSAEYVCGECASCVAADIVQRIDAETDRRLAASTGPAERAIEFLAGCPGCGEEPEAWNTAMVEPCHGCGKILGCRLRVDDSGVKHWSFYFAGAPGVAR